MLRRDWQIERQRGDRMNTIKETNEVPVVAEYDIIVVGGGIAAMGAALGARRNGLKVLVIEKSVVDIHSNAFRVAEASREDWLAAFPGVDNFRKPGPIRFSGKSEEERPITLALNAIGR